MSYETASLYGYLKRYILLFEKGAPVKPKTKIGFTPVESLRVLLRSNSTG